MSSGKVSNTLSKTDAGALEGYRRQSSHRLAGLRQLGEPDGRSRFLTIDQIDTLLRACEESPSPYLRPFVLALKTGMRRGESGLSRKSIDWANKIATLGQTKNGDD